MLFTYSLTIESFIKITLFIYALFCVHYSSIFFLSMPRYESVSICKIRKVNITHTHQNRNWIHIVRYTGEIHTIHKHNQQQHNFKKKNRVIFCFFFSLKRFSEINVFFGIPVSKLLRSNTKMCSKMEISNREHWTIKIKSNRFSNKALNEYTSCFVYNQTQNNWIYWQQNEKIHTLKIHKNYLVQ